MVRVSKLRSTPFILVALVFGLELQAKDNFDYSVANIPPALLENANSVIRKDHVTFEVLKQGVAHKRVHYVLTILNENADKYASYVEGYDKLESINSFQANLYDSRGKLVKRAKNSDFIDQSAVSGYSIYEDNRMQYVEFDYPYHPYTVEFIVETKSKNLLHYPTNYFLNGFYRSVQEARFEVIIPKSLDLHYKEHNFEGEFNKLDDGENHMYSWVASNLSAIEPERFGPAMTTLLPKVETAPNHFAVDGIKGSLTTWKEFGDWGYKLTEGRTELPLATATKVKSLVDGIEDDKEKIKVLYEYLQSKTRYVSIQLGIGGYQPFPADYVNENGFGDCKALSNYMSSILDICGIESYNAWIEAGGRPEVVDEEFVIDKFNHVILCVPNHGDTVWLECTSQISPFGYLGDFTSDRKALLLTENGGKLVNTPVYPRKVNTQIRNAYVDLRADRPSKVQIKTEYSGLQFENVYYFLIESDSDIKKRLYSSIDIPEFNIVSFSYEKVGDEMPTAIEHLELEIDDIGNQNGKRWFFTPNLSNRRKMISKQISQRRTDIWQDMAYEDIDSITFTLPDGFHIEYLPKPISFESEFGSYQSQYIQGNGTLTYIRKRVQEKGLFPKASYKSYVDFLNRIAKSDNEKIVLVKNT